MIFMKTVHELIAVVLIAVVQENTLFAGNVFIGFIYSSTTYPVLIDTSNGYVQFDAVLAIINPLVQLIVVLIQKLQLHADSPESKNVVLTTFALPLNTPV